MIALKLLLNNARAGDNPRREMSLPVSCLIRAAVTEMDSAMLLWLGAAVGCHVANSIPRKKWVINNNTSS